jgi:Spy/CpxP family protein refolding chaperone
MRGNKLRFVLVVSVILNLSFLTAAGYQYYNQSAYWISPFGYKIQKGHYLFEELSLRPEQLKAMKETASRFRAVSDEKRQAIASKRKELITLLRQDNPDKEAIAVVVSQISGMQEQLQKMIALHMLDMKSGLDKEQQKKFLDLVENAMTEGRKI